MMAEAKYRDDGKLFTPWMLLLCVAGLLVNLALSRLVQVLDLPLYIDNVGHVVVAVLGGGLPGMTVAFLSNVLGSEFNSISMYYSVFSIIIAWLAAHLSRRGMLGSWKGWLAAALCFALVGGGAGSVMTWFLYGQEISGIAAPLALVLADHGFAPFFAQLTADILVDIPDKLITVALAWLLVRLVARLLPGKFPESHLYDGGRARAAARADAAQGADRGKKSVQMRITGIVIGAVVAVGSFPLATGCYYYYQQMATTCRSTAQMVSAQAALCVDGDAVLDQLAGGRQADGYLETEQKLYAVLAKAPELIRYIYVYRITEQGIHVVYDLDVPDDPGREVGTLITDDADIAGRLDAFLAGGDVDPGVENAAFGSLVSAYTPVYDSTGATVAYACADVDTAECTDAMLLYFIQNLAILFAVMLLGAYVTMWFVNRRVTAPLRGIVDHTKQLSMIEPVEWLESDAWKNRPSICTNDEIEELYTAVTATEEYASVNVRKRMQAERELVQTKALEEANRALEAMIVKADEASRAKTEFFSRMSHDMRTPMNGILGLAELSRDEDDPAVLKANVKKIAQSGTYLLGLINDTLDFQKIESGKMKLEPRAVRVGELVGDVLTMIDLEARRKDVGVKPVQVGIEMDSMVKVDPMRVKQIFFNLLSNAVKFTPAGGSVEVRVERVSCADGIAHDVITVTDTGIGMSPEFLEGGIFQAFSQEHSDIVANYAGSGLGLSIAKKLVELMGGTIEVQSELGEGTRFTVTLDFELVDGVAEQDDGACTEQQRRQAQKALCGKRVLLAEDHPLNAEIAQRLLAKAGCEVAWAPDGQACVERFCASQPGEFALILMDIRMPKMDGLAATRAIRALDRPDARAVPIIAMTANAYDTDIKNCMDAGMDDHIAKPLDVDRMFQVMAAHL